MCEVAPPRIVKFQELNRPLCSRCPNILAKTTVDSLPPSSSFANNFRSEQPGYPKVFKMQIIVTAPTGASTAYAVEGSTTISTLKTMIENQEYIPEHLIRLVSGDVELSGGTLAGNGLEEDDEVSLLLDVPGGMRAKWRKKRMRRLRRKRRKMRQRAR